MKSKLKMSMKILAAINKCLILVIIRSSQNSMVVQAILPLKKLQITLEVLQLDNLLD